MTANDDARSALYDPWMSIDTLIEIGPLVALLAFGAWLGMALQRFVWRIRAGARRRRNTNNRDGAPTRQAPFEPARTQDAAEQLRIVMRAEFIARPLLNQSEARVFDELCQIVSRCRPDWRVMAQVSLGEVLRSRDTEAFSCINSKRVDILLVDEASWPRHAIEYHGGGHYQGTAAARDAVKKEALRRAGVGYHEVVAGKTTPADLRQLFENLISETDTHSK
jgi:hypothetical protein